jgi:hypothetical protein
MSGMAGTQALRTALRILEVLAGWTGPEALPRPAAGTLGGIAGRLAVPEASAFRALEALTETGWVERVGTEYRLAFKVGVIGVGVHTALQHQAETLQGMLGHLAAARTGIRMAVEEPSKDRDPEPEPSGGPAGRRAAAIQEVPQPA